MSEHDTNLCVVSQGFDGKIRVLFESRSEKTDFGEEARDFSDRDRCSQDPFGRGHSMRSKLLYIEERHCPKTIHGPIPFGAVYIMVNHYVARKESGNVDDVYHELEDKIRAIDGVWTPLTFHEMFSQCEHCGAAPCLEKKVRCAVVRFVFETWGLLKQDFPSICETQEDSVERKKKFFASPRDFYTVLSTASPCIWSSLFA